MRRFTVTVLAATTVLATTAAVAAASSSDPATIPGAPSLASPVLVRPALRCLEIPDAGAITDFTLPDLTNFTLPDLTNFTLPDLTNFTLPDLSKFTIPGLSDFTIPDLSGITLPDLTNFTMPDLSNFTLPDLSGISMPEIGGVPEVATPDATQVRQVMARPGMTIGWCEVGPTTAIDPFAADAEFGKTDAGWAVDVSVKPESIDAVTAVLTACTAGDSTCPNKEVAVEIDGVVVSHSPVTSATVTGKMRIADGLDEEQASALAERLNGAPSAPAPTTPADVTPSS